MNQFPLTTLNSLLEIGNNSPGKQAIGIAVLDANGQFIYSNNTFGDFIHASIQSGISLQDLVLDVAQGEDFLETVKQSFQSVLHKRVSVQREVEIAGQLLQFCLHPTVKSDIVQAAVVIELFSLYPTTPTSEHNRAYSLFLKDVLLKIGRYDGTWKQYSKYTIKVLARALDLEKSTIWYFNEKKSLLKGVYRYDIASGSVQRFNDFRKIDFHDRFFSTLASKESFYITPVEESTYWIGKLYERENIWGFIELTPANQDGFSKEEQHFLAEALQLVNVRTQRYRDQQQDLDAGSMAIPVLTINELGKVIYCNPAGRSILNQWSALSSFNAPVRIVQKVLETLSTNGLIRFEEVVGSEIYSVLVDPDRNLKICTLYFSEISEIKAKEEQRLYLQKEEQRNIANAVLDALEKERLRVAQDLHDNLGQLLTNCKLQLDLVQSNFELSDHQNIEALKSSLQKAILETKQLARSFMPTSITEIGLYDSIDELCKTSLLKQGRPLFFDGTIDEEKLDDTVKIVIYRIVQELINNVQKHSEATHAEISINTDKKSQMISIHCEDNGVGFDIQKVEKGLGLQNISNRLELLNGSFTLHSDGDGTKVTVLIPC